MSRTARALVIVIGIVLLLAAVAGIVAFAFLGFGRGLAFGYRGFGPGILRIFPFGGGIITLLLTALAIGSIVWLVQSLARGGDHTRISTPVNETPLDILKRRYAKGEITKEQYDQMRQDLGV